MRKAYQIVNVAIGSVIIMILASVNHDVFGDSVWLSRIFLVATTGFVIFCTLLAVGSISNTRIRGGKMKPKMMPIITRCLACPYYQVVSANGAGRDWCCAVGRELENVSSTSMPDWCPLDGQYIEWKRYEAR